MSDRGTHAPMRMSGPSVPHQGLVHMSELSPQQRAIPLLTTSPSQAENYSNATHLPLMDLSRQQGDGMLDMSTSSLPPSRPQAATTIEPYVSLGQRDILVSPPFDSYHGGAEPLDAEELHRARDQIPAARPISPDECSNSPGSLTIAFSGCSSSNDNSGEEDGPEPLNLSSSGQPARESRESSPSGLGQLGGRRKGIPHKLRHKYGFGLHYDDSLSHLNNITSQNSGGPHGEKFSKEKSAKRRPSPARNSVLREQCPADGADEPSDSDVSMSSTFSSSSVAALDATVSNHSSGRNHHHPHHYHQHHSSGRGDPKYLERRRRNNLAARKCRENRRQANMMRVTKSRKLESENSKLKDELHNLTAEVKSLKQMIEKKIEAKTKSSENVQPPQSPPSMDSTQVQNGMEAAS